MFFLPFFGPIWTLLKNLFLNLTSIMGRNVYLYLLARPLNTKKGLNMKKKFISKSFQNFVIFGHFEPFLEFLIVLVVTGQVRKPRGWSHITYIGYNLPYPNKYANRTNFPYMGKARGWYCGGGVRGVGKGSGAEAVAGHEYA